jgi:hypothetical protein
MSFQDDVANAPERIDSHLMIPEDAGAGPEPPEGASIQVAGAAAARSCRNYEGSVRCADLSAARGRAIILDRCAGRRLHTLQQLSRPPDEGRPKAARGRVQEEMMKKALSMLALAAVVFSALPVLAEDEHDHSAEMAMWAEMLKPTPHHEHLAKMAGDWTIHSKFMMDPSAPPDENDGTAKMTMVGNGLFLQESVQSPMMGQPWSGYGVFGFDKTANKHIGTWYDSFGTSIMMFTGECADNCATVTMTGSYVDPMTKQPTVMKTVSSMTDADHAMNKMYTVVDGKDVFMGEVAYTRKK